MFAHSLPCAVLRLLNRLTNSVRCIAIHSAAGPELLAECRTVPEVRPGVRCPTGEARITRRALVHSYRRLCLHVCYCAVEVAAVGFLIFC